MRVYLDVESAGLKGRLHTIQYALGRNYVKILRVSQNPDYSELLSILRDKETVLVGFNLGFDLWKLYQLFQPGKPFQCQTLDLYQHTLKSKPLCYFPLIGGKAVIKVNKVPSYYVDKVQEKIEKKLNSVLPPIAKIKVKESCKNYLTSLEFTVKIPAKLKILARLFLLDDGEVEEILNFSDVLKLPKDCGWTEDKRFPVIRSIEEEELYEALWRENESILDSPAGQKSLKYMVKDVEYLWKLEDWLLKQGNTVEIDDDDICTHVVAYTKYFGFPVDKPLAKEIQDKYREDMVEIKDSLGINPESPYERLSLLKEHANIPQAITSTDSLSLKILTEETEAGILTEQGLEIAAKLYRYKPLAQRRKQLEVITEGDGRVYPDFVVLGTTTHRMRGTGGLNFQGIARDGDIRRCFLTSMGGDFDGLEWCIAANVYQDPAMLRGLREGTDAHTLAVLLLKEEYCLNTYEELIQLKAAKDPDFLAARNKMKRVNFGVLYQAGPVKIGLELNCPPEEAEQKMNDCYFSHYKTLAENRKNLLKQFCTADFLAWDKSSVGKMADHVTGVFGDVRWICFEKFAAHFLWSSAKEFADLAGGDQSQILRSELKGKQEIGQAIVSAILGAASGIQKTVMRQLGNYTIQNAGARLTKKLMRRLWECHHVPMLNVHDEIDVPGDWGGDYESVKKTVDEFLSKYSETFEKLEMSWQKTRTWADK